MVAKLMRVALLALTLFVAFPIVAVASPNVQLKTERKECVVYVTRTGAKYHEGRCRYLRQSKIPITRSEATRAGYTPCKVCGGACE